MQGGGPEQVVDLFGVAKLRKHFYHYFSFLWEVAGSEISCRRGIEKEKSRRKV